MAFGIGKKLKKAFGGKGALWGAALGALAGPAGALVGAGIGSMKDSADRQKAQAKEELAEQERANAEAKAIEEAQGVAATKDNTSEALSESAQNKKRRGYTSTLASRSSNSLLGAASYGRNRLG